MDVEEYFTSKASDYDDVDLQLFWMLSDKLLRRYLSIYFYNKIVNNGNIVDMGAGTGRWSENSLKQDKVSCVHLIDNNRSMLSVAKKKLEGKYKNKVVIYSLQDVLHVTENEYGKFDGITCLHNVLGFIRDSKELIKTCTEISKPGTVLALMAPSIPHSISFNIANNNVPMALAIGDTHIGRYTKQMPDMRFFPLNQIVNELTSFGWNVQNIIGFPLFITPSINETLLHGQDENLATLLTDDHIFQKIVDLEIRYHDQVSADRGCDILYIANRRID